MPFSTLHNTTILPLLNFLLLVGVYNLFQHSSHVHQVRGHIDGRKSTSKMPSLDYPNPFLADKPYTGNSSCPLSPLSAIEKAKSPVPPEDKLQSGKTYRILLKTYKNYQNPFLATEPLDDEPSIPRCQSSTEAPEIQETKCSKPPNPTTIGFPDKLKQQYIPNKKQKPREVTQVHGNGVNIIPKNKVNKKIRKKSPTLPVAKDNPPTEVRRVNQVQGNGVNTIPKNKINKKLEKKSPASSVGKDQAPDELTCGEVFWILTNQLDHVNHLVGPQDEAAVPEGLSGLVRNVGDMQPILSPSFAKELIISLTDEVISSVDDYKNEVVGFQDKLEQRLFPNKKSDRGNMNLVDPVIVEVQVPSAASPFVHRLLWGTLELVLSCLTFYKPPCRA